jgi:hypothetical protein
MQNSDLAPVGISIVIAGLSRSWITGAQWLKLCTVQLMSPAAEPCMIHTLQLVMGDGLKDQWQWAVKDTLAIGRSIVGHFRHSSANTRLEQIQLENLVVPKGDELRVIQDLYMRWNSNLSAWSSGLGRAPSCFTAHEFVQFVKTPGRTRQTKPSIPLGSVNW